VVASLIVVVGAALIPMSTPAGAASPADLGVTPTTIRIGIPVIDFPALQAVGVFINDGNFQDAYTALTASINAHGGIDGRKVVPSFVETNPAVASSGTTSCDALTEDDHVFVVMLPVYPECYQVTHDTPVIDGSIPVTVPASAAPDFNLVPPGTAYDPVQFAAFVKRGTFKGKKIGIYYGSPVDQAEATEVQSDLKKLHVDVVLLAGSSAPATDTVAVDQATQTIAQRFQNGGVNEVIAVGPSGATDWPRSLKDTQSSYKPPWIATQEGSLSDVVGSAKGGNPYLDNVMASSPTPSVYQQWQDPAMQKCDAIVRKAYPSDPIAPPVNPTSPSAAASGTDTTYAAVESACQNLAILTAIADRAGKNLTVASFTKAGYGLKNVTFPGSGGAVSFGTNQPFALGPTNFVVYDVKSGSLVAAPGAQG
jgi:hypothetical protein